MNELIWFSIPGAIFLAGLRLCPANIRLWLGLGDIHFSAPIIIVAIPITGFIIHQSFRVCFELRGGWHRHSRRVIDELMTVCNIKDRSDAFLIWEMTLYSDKKNCPDTGECICVIEPIPTAFRDHNRRAWHFVLSFWSCALACAMSASLILWFIFWDYKEIYKERLWLSLCIFIVIGIILWRKAQGTYQDIHKQEKAAVLIYKAAFLSTAKNFRKHQE